MRVIAAEYVKDYKIKLKFSDGSIKIVDFKHFLKNAKNLLVPLLDMDYFKRFTVDDTTISWPNEVDFCPDVLHEIGEEIIGSTSSKRLDRLARGDKSEIKQPAHAFSKKKQRKPK